MAVLQPRGIRTLNQFSRNLVLSVIDGPKKGLRVIVPPGQSCVVGRTTASQVACEDDYMSSKHFEVCNRIEHYFVKDLNSRNGTKVLDEAITSEKSLNQTTRISAGKSLFEVAWEPTNEEWGTQAGSSISIRRSSTNFTAPPNPSRAPLGDGPLSSTPGSVSQSDFRVAPTNMSVYSALDERIAAICLDMFHASISARRDGLAPVFERLYNWSKHPLQVESFLSDFYLSNLDFFAIASFSKLGIPNPGNLFWYPIFPGVDPNAAASPVAIPKRAWLENCHLRWFDRLSNVDGISFVVTDSSSSPDLLLSQLNRGFRSLVSQSAGEDLKSQGSGEIGPGVFPWYSPMELLATIGTRTEEGLANWLPPVVQGLVFPIRPSGLSFAFVRPGIAGALRERGFRAVSDT